MVENREFSDSASVGWAKTGLASDQVKPICGSIRAVLRPDLASAWESGTPAWPAPITTAS
jgi:hypothetical protein